MEAAPSSSVNPISTEEECGGARSGTAVTWVSTAGTWPPRTGSTARSGKSSGTPGSGSSGRSPTEQRRPLGFDGIYIST